MKQPAWGMLVQQTIGFHKAQPVACALSNSEDVAYIHSDLDVASERSALT